MLSPFCIIDNDEREREKEEMEELRDQTIDKTKVCEIAIGCDRVNGCVYAPVICAGYNDTCKIPVSFVSLFYCFYSRFLLLCGRVATCEPDV